MDQRKKTTWWVPKKSIIINIWPNNPFITIHKLFTFIKFQLLIALFWFLKSLFIFCNLIISFVWLSGRSTKMGLSEASGIRSTMVMKPVHRLCQMSLFCGWNKSAWSQLKKKTSRAIFWRMSKFQTSMTLSRKLTSFCLWGINWSLKASLMCQRRSHWNMKQR